MKIKAVLFDMDGTLVDAREWHKIALNEALEIFGTSISDESHKLRFDGLSTKMKLNLLSESENFPRDLHEIVFAVKQDRTLRIAASRCYPIASIQILLKRLEMTGLKLAVVTNSIRETSEFMLKYSGIRDFFELLITNEDVQNSKPSPEGYLLACKKLGVNVTEVLVVEDGDYGIQSAKSAGIVNILRVEDPSQVNLDLFQKYIGNQNES